MIGYVCKCIIHRSRKCVCMSNSLLKRQQRENIVIVKSRQTFIVTKLVIKCMMHWGITRICGIFTVYAHIECVWMNNPLLTGQERENVVIVALRRRFHITQ